MNSQLPECPAVNKTDRVLSELRRRRITSVDMIHRFAITRLATHIYALRQDGYRIRSENITVGSLDGQPITVARYTLLGKRRGVSPRLRKAKAKPAKRQAARRRRAA